MGRVLGRIHTALARFPAPDAARYPAKLLWNSGRAADEMREYEAAIAAFPAQAPFDQHALASFAYRRTLLAAGVPQPAAFADLPAQMLHGDYHEGNLFFGPDGAVTSVIDWELASSGPRALEIVRTLDVALAATGDDPSAALRRRAFLHAYAAEAPLTRDECLAMPELYWAYRVHSLWVYEEHYRKGSARTDHLALADIPALTWWLQHRHQLSLRLADELGRAPGARSSPPAPSAALSGRPTGPRRRPGAAGGGGTITRGDREPPGEVERSPEGTGNRRGRSRSCCGKRGRPS